MEPDCPWFSPEWLLDHPDFPLNPAASDEAERRHVPCRQN